MGKRIFKNGDIIGDIEFKEYGKNGRITCRCLLCDNIFEYTTSNLKNKKHKDCGCKKRLGNSNGCWRGVGDISKSVFCYIQQDAKKRNILFDITIEQLARLFIEQDRKCALSGVELCFSNQPRQRKQTTASLDRIDSSKPYTIDNVWWVHKDVNLAKQKLSVEDFINLCRNVANYRRTQ